MLVGWVGGGVEGEGRVGEGTGGRDTSILRTKTHFRNTKPFYKQSGRRHAYKNRQLFWSLLCNLQYWFIIAKHYILVPLVWGVACVLYLHLNPPGKKYNLHSLSLRHSTWFTICISTPKTFCSHCCRNVILNIYMYMYMLNTLYTQRTNVPMNQTYMHNKMLCTSERLYTTPA